MAEYSYLISEVSDVLDDSSFERTLIGKKINEGLRDVAGRVLLKELETTATVDTDSDNKVDLPDDFHRRLSPWAHSITHNRRIKVWKSLPQLFKNFRQLDLSGSVVGVARQGKELYYQRIPASAETIRINYFKVPTALSVDTDEPDCLPVHTHISLLVNYALWQLFARKEDGMEGEGANTARYRGYYEKALAELTYFIGPTSDVPEWPEDEFDYNYLVNVI